jgi:phage repressor protein C with HTH and peptisase S24 domain
MAVNYFDGDGICFRFSGDLFVKRLQKLKAACMFSQTTHSTRQITNEEMDMLHVCGKVLLSQSQQFRRHA